MDDRFTLYGSFTSSSSYKPMLFLALARLPFSFRTVNLKTGEQKTPDYLAVNRYGLVPALRHRGLTIVQSNVILDYLARVTGTIRRRERAGSLAGARVAVLGGGRHPEHRPRAPLQPLPHRRSGGHGALPPAGRSGARLHGQVARRAATGWSARPARSPTSAAGAAWCSWPKAAWTSPAGPTSRPGRAG